MDILASISRATELFDEGLTLYNRISTEVKDGKNALEDETLEEARARLDAAMKRAQVAHDDLHSAIQARLNK